MGHIGRNINELTSQHEDVMQRLSPLHQRCQLICFPIFEERRYKTERYGTIILK